jgi:hypothetical protein
MLKEAKNAGQAKEAAALQAKIAALMKTIAGLEMHTRSPGLSVGKEGSVMMKNKRQEIVGILAIGLLTASGCATTDNPREGGLFGYNPKAYERRIAERESALKTLQDDQAREQQETKQLEDSISRKQAEKDALDQQLARIDADIGKIAQQVQKTKVQTKVQEQKRTKLSAEIKALKVQRDNLTQSPASDLTAQRAEIDKLERQLELRRQEAEALARP